MLLEKLAEWNELGDGGQDSRHWEGDIWGNPVDEGESHETTLEKFATRRKRWYKNLGMKKKPQPTIHTSLWNKNMVKLAYNTKLSSDCLNINYFRLIFSKIKS